MSWDTEGRHGVPLTFWRPGGEDSHGNRLLQGGAQRGTDSVWRDPGAGVILPTLAGFSVAPSKALEVEPSVTTLPAPRCTRAGLGLKIPSPLVRDSIASYHIAWPGIHIQMHIQLPAVFV